MNRTNCSSPCAVVRRRLPGAGRRDQGAHRRLRPRRRTPAVARARPLRERGTRAAYRRAGDAEEKIEGATDRGLPRRRRRGTSRSATSAKSTSALLLSFRSPSRRLLLPERPALLDLIEPMADDPTIDGMTRNRVLREPLRRLKGTKVTEATSPAANASGRRAMHPRTRTSTPASRTSGRPTMSRSAKRASRPRARSSVMTTTGASGSGSSPRRAP
jgi:hypothetical protein